MNSVGLPGAAGGGSNSMVVVYPRDVIMLICLACMAALVLANWNDFGACDPLNLWLLVDLVALISFRLVQFLFQLAYSINGRRRRGVAFVFMRLLGFVNLWILYPFLWTWVVIGIYWFSRSFRCLPDDNPPFGFFAWILFTALYLAFYAVLIFISYRLHQIRREQLRVEHLQELLADFHQVQAYGLAEAKTGLSPAEIDELPVTMVQPHDEAVTCSICLADLQPDDVYRRLPCRHRFHLVCLDQWLQIKDTCPNCLRRVMETESSSLLPI